MRLQNMDANIQSSEFDKSRIYEFILLNFCQLILNNTDKTYTFYLYSILQMNQAIIPNVANIQPPNPFAQQQQQQPTGGGGYQRSAPTNTEDAREVLFGKNSGWAGSFDDEAPRNKNAPSYMINI